MKQILAGMFAVGTAFASYNAYKTDQFGPLITEIKQMRLPSPLALVTSALRDSQSGSGYTNPLNQTAFASSGVQTGYNPGYAGLLLPHLQAAFSPLESNSAKLAEAPLLRLREILERDHETAEAREAIRVLEQLRGLLREREIYRARFEEGARRFDGESFRHQVAQEWLARGREFAPSFERAYADLSAREEVSRQHGGPDGRIRESYAEMARRDSATKPQFEGHADYGAFAHREPAHADLYPNPLVQNRNSFGEHRNEPTEYHSPLEQGSTHGGVGSATGHETYFAGSHQSSTQRPAVEGNRASVTTAPTGHYVNPPPPHPVTKPPPPVAHPAPPAAVVHTN